MIEIPEGEPGHMIYQIRDQLEETAVQQVAISEAHTRSATASSKTMTPERLPSLQPSDFAQGEIKEACC